jgi:hypothetical protein
MPPEGMGAVRLNINKNVARTILPDYITADDFDEFELFFTKYDGGTGTAMPVMQISKADINDPIDLLPDTYNLLVLAYLDAGDPDPAAAWDSRDTAAYNITVGTSLTPVPVTVKLTGITDGSGEGTFEWDIDLSGITFTYTTIVAEMEITEIGGSFNDTIDIEANPQDEVTLDSGYYYVDFTITVDTTNIVTFRQVLHIYNNMTSSFTYAFVNGHFGITSGKVQLTINYADKGTVIVLAKGGPAPVASEDTITLTGTNSETVTITNIASFDSTDWAISRGTGLALTGTAGSEDELTITAGTVPFVAGTNGSTTYIVTITAEDKDGVPSSIFFYVKIDS